MQNKLRVVVSYLAYPMTMATWFIRALQRRDDVELIRVAPYFGTFIPWSKPNTDPRLGMNLSSKYLDPPEIALPQSMANVHLHPQMLRDKLPDNIDLWIEIDSMFHFSARPPCKIHALIKPDPHVLAEWYKSIEDRVDFSFGMQEAYLKPKDIYLPYAYDPTVHYPIQTKYPIEKEYDVCLVGLLYPQRAALINKLRADGLKVFYDIGLIFDEYREVYNKSKIALSWSTLNDTPARFFEGMAMRLPVVANRTPDAMHLFVPGQDFIPFSTLEEAEQQILNLLLDDPFMKMTADAGYKAVQVHSYDARTEFILKTVGLI
jgi:glycosyltransferase involved in cell wall biosynthesis